MNSSITRKVVNAIDNVDASLGAFITVGGERALRSASVAPKGDLYGLTIGVKDLIDVTGLPTTYGSPRFRNHYARHTAASITALESRGAIVIGKTNLNEFAFGVSGYNPHYGPILLPGDPSRTAGGSSGGGAVAVLEGACQVGVGTDTSGSVRIPAACCGIWGFKCAHGLDLSGVHPLAPSLDSLGYIATNPADLESILGLDTLPSANSLRIGRIGEDVFPPALPASHWVIFRHEAWSVHRAAFNASPDKFGKDLQRKLRQPLGDLAVAKLDMAAWRNEFVRTTYPFDALVQPVFEGKAPLLQVVLAEYEFGGYADSSRLMKNTPVANALGWPALAFPGRGEALEVLASPGREANLFAVARALSPNKFR
ncbi:MAG: amidase [Candidatus Saccharibacteria bacterium]|nr:amidase [Microbacteriaceae bacterium]